MQKTIRKLLPQMEFIVARIFTPIFIVAFSLVLISCEEKVENSAEDSTPSEKIPIELLPRDNDISGWTRDGISIEATNYDALYQVINGGAQTYIDNNFVSAAFQDYKSTSGLSLHLRIYEQSTIVDVEALYEYLTPAAPLPWVGGVPGGRIDDSALIAYTVEFIKGRFFVQVVIDKKSDVALEIAKLFASHVASEISE